MHLSLLLLALFGIALAKTTLWKRQPANGTTGRWLIKLRNDVDQAAVEQHLRWVTDVHKRSIRRRQTAGVERQFSIGDFHAYVADFDESTVSELADSDDVIAIEPDYTGTTNAIITASGQPWGLSSISSRRPLGNGAGVDGQTYVYDSSAGTGTFGYVLDSGIRLSHPGYGGRAVAGLNVYPNYAFEECPGHGTHVAGTVGSTPFGVAKNTTIVSVKVVRSCAYTDAASVIQGLEWVVRNATAVPGKAGRSVISMSLALPRSAILDDAVDATTAAGVFVVVGAGNDGADASMRSPASAPSAFTVGTIAINNTRPAWSNYGPLVDIFAPGVQVRSTSIFQDGTELLSGTSMSTPHVAGLALYLKALEGSALDSPAAVGARIKALATKDVVVEGGAGSPSLVAYNGNGRD